MVKQDITRAATIDDSRCRVLGITPTDNGHITVVFAILPSDDATESSPVEAMNDIQEQLGMLGTIYFILFYFCIGESPLVPNILFYFFLVLCNLTR